MSVDLSSERVCYVHCNFCTTILALSCMETETGTWKRNVWKRGNDFFKKIRKRVSVPYASLFTLVTVRCGHCTNLLSLNIGVSLHQTTPPPTHQDLQPHKQHITSSVTRKDCASSSRSTNNLSENMDREAPRMPPIRPPEKRQRVPSAYNRFIKEEIQRIKTCNPEISHREAFSTAAKNWAHFPHIHFGLKLDGNKKGKQLDQSAAGQKSNGYF